MEAEAQQLDRVECPSCGGAGGGPFGRAGSAWDDEDFVCPRCKGAGALALDDLLSSPSPSPSPSPSKSPAPSQRPGIVKVVPDVVAPSTEKKRKASA